MDGEIEAKEEIADSLVLSNKVINSIATYKVETKYITQVIPLSKSGEILKDWLKLAEEACEPNPFYSPDYLNALVENICKSEKHWLILVWSNDTQKKLLGLFPVTVKGIKQGFLFPVTSFTFHPLVGVCTPLIARAKPKEIWTSFFTAIENHPGFSGVIYIPEFYIDGTIGQALQELIRDRKFVLHVQDDFKRAVAFSHFDFPTYCDGWSKKKVRNIRVRERKLKELGVLSFEILDARDVNYQEAYEAILLLEKSGWKGRKKTALASKPNTRAFSELTFASKNKVPLYHIALLKLDGKTIAGQLNLVSQKCVFFIKSAYDEKLSSYGPGVLLYKLVLQKMLEEGCYDELDSCADANHPLSEIWLESKRVQSMFLAPSTMPNKKKLKQIIIWHQFVQMLRTNLKLVYVVYRKTNLTKLMRK
jgi:hypothetical protein